MGRQENGVPSQGAPASIGETAMAFLKRRAGIFAIAFVAIASLRIISTYDRLSLTFDEPAHMACGMEYVAKHVYQYESQHPPLSRAMIAIGPYLAGVRPHAIERFTPEGIEEVKASANPMWTVRLMRAGILPYFWIASLVVFIWAGNYFGRSSAVLATALFSLLPPVLAHAGLATTDMALTASLPAAILTTVLWAQSPTWGRTVLMGLACAFTALTKFSALGYLPAAVALCLAASLMTVWPGWRELYRLIVTRALKFAAAVAIGAVAIWAVYWFSFGEVPGTGWRLPAPEFFDGIGVAWKHSTGGHGAYLLGKTSKLGWWYFFPVALAVKTPIAFLILVAAGLAVCWRQRQSSQYLFLPAAALGILGPAMTSHVNIGIRHILPIYPILCLIGAMGLANMIRSAKTSLGLVASILIIWLAVSGAAYHPNYLTYFNEFAASDPEAVLVDSDLDWGQDLVALSTRLRAAGVAAIKTNFGPYFSSRSLYDLPPMQAVDPNSPSIGWSVVSPTAAKLTVAQPILSGLSVDSLTTAYQNRTPWWDRTSPTERVGSLKLYYFASGSLPAP
jgi:4-amino-4-deoxy-L-arabinose transferase-like glycosyltransferase